MKFLIVYEDGWNNKNNIISEKGKLGYDILKLIEYNCGKNYYVDINLSKLNSNNPYDLGTLGLGFNDIEIYDENKEGYIGRIMIFNIK